MSKSVRTHQVILFTISILYVLNLSFAAEWNWHIETVDNSGNTGWYSSIAIDADGYPNIAYYDATNDDLKFARWNGSDWEIDIIDSDGNVGRYPSLVIDTSGNRHISYSRNYSNDSELKYGYWDGFSWNIEIVETVDWNYLTTSLALDSYDNPHITYGEWFTMKYAYWNGSIWDIHNNPDDFEGYFSDIVVDSNGIVHMSYQRDMDVWEELKYAKWDGSHWSTYLVDSAIDGMAEFSEILVDSEDNPHIFYTGPYDQSSLEYAYWNGASWELQTIYGGYADYPSATSDSSGEFHILICDGYIFGPLKYLYQDGPSWENEYVRYSANRGKWTSLALDNSDVPHISYRFDRSLRYGCMAWVTYPESFNLISPPDDAYIAEEPILLDWEDSSSSEGPITYELWYCTEWLFGGGEPEHETIEGLTESEYEIPVGTLDWGEEYYWAVRAYDGYEETWCNQLHWVFTYGEPSNADDTPPTPTAFSLSPAYPNPSSDSATIAFVLPRACALNLEVFDVKGRKVATLAEETLPAGEYERKVSGLSSGVYLYRLTASDFVEIKKMVVK